MLKLSDFTTIRFIRITCRNRMDVNELVPTTGIQRQDGSGKAPTAVCCGLALA